MERTPLLGNLVRSSQHDEEGQVSAGDHPIFLRAAHSPWQSLNQNALSYIRGVVLAYIVVTSGMLIDYKICHRKDEHSNWRIPFEFSTVTWFLLLLYHTMVFSWTLTHMHWPDIDANDTRWKSRLLRFMSPPEQRPGSRRRFYFSLFYSVTHAFSLLNVVNYWAVLGITFEGWFPAFCLFNLYVFPAVITLIETTVLNSVRRPEVGVGSPGLLAEIADMSLPQPVPSHLFGTMLFAALYLAYGGLGAKATGHVPFFWMDEDEVGSTEKVAGYCIGFIVLSAAMFSMLYGLIGMRETVSGRAHSD
ncbi:hypothetical protein VP1G_01907 [Cytospora mali]|uniref:Uncharacterized protein n=1 Tax=Cytospora mali TaxID=578113 RepID=A0A194US12_CYTMA|nr:hypothetical protein VP1G_01907 [Valsa mali var. pyri (nom. inval.)]